MLRVIKSELYKTRHRLYPYIFIGVIVALGLAGVMLFAVTNHYLPPEERVGFDGMVSIALSMFPTGLFLTVAFVDMVFSEEYKNPTMKNTLAFGTSRAGFYLGKLLTELITAREPSRHPGRYTGSRCPSAGSRLSGSVSRTVFRARQTSACDPAPVDRGALFRQHAGFPRQEQHSVHTGFRRLFRFPARHPPVCGALLPVSEGGQPLADDPAV